MKKVLLFLALVTVMSLLIVPVADAKDHRSCKGLLNALRKIPSGTHGYERVLAKAQERCGESLDRAALVALYHSTNGDSWGNNEFWLDENIHHCDWWRVTCNDEGRVYYLSLSFNQLNGSIPPELGYLGKLELIDLAYNELSGSIPAEVGYMKELRNLTFHFNNLSGSIPPEIGNLNNLTHLELSSNELNGPIPPELGNLSSLIYLDLFNNQLNGQIPPELGNLSNLEILSLSINQLSGPIPKELVNLGKLDQLYLYQNQLTCWETAVVLQWAQNVPYSNWDYPYPGEVVCP